MGAMSHRTGTRQLRAHLAQHAGIDPETAERQIEALVTVIIDQITAGHSVTIGRLGTFRIEEQRQRKRGDAPVNVVRFSMNRTLASSLKEILNPSVSARVATARARDTQDDQGAPERTCPRRTGTRQ